MKATFDDGGLFLDDLGLGAGASHGRTQEDVDDEHNEEEDAEGDTQVQQPQRMDTRTIQHRHCQ